MSTLFYLLPMAAKKRALTYPFNPSLLLGFSWRLYGGRNAFKNIQNVFYPVYFVYLIYVQQASTLLEVYIVICQRIYIVYIVNRNVVLCAALVSFMIFYNVYIGWGQAM